MNTLEPPIKKPFLSPFALRSLFGSMLRFLASVRLAVMILITLMVVLATGTIIESLHGTDAARMVVYNTAWFSLLLLVLGINVATAAISRFPWKIRHVGFVITHAGILLILAGSFMTQQLMLDGQMVISEGETEHRITLSEPVLYIFSEKEQRTNYVNLEKKPFPWQGRSQIRQANDGAPLPFDLSVTAYYPKAKMKEEIIPIVFMSFPHALGGNPKDSNPGSPTEPFGDDKKTNPALKIRLHNNFVDHEAWLIRNHPGSSEVQMGPAKLVFANELLKENSAQPADAAYLEFEWEKRKIHIPLKSDLKLPAVFPLKGTSYRIRILEIFRNAMVMGKELVEQKGTGHFSGLGRKSDPSPFAGENPAVQMLLQGDGLEERHTVFAKYPDFPTVHGMKPSASGARVFYRLPNAGSRGETHEIRFTENDGKLLCQIQEGLKVTTHEAVKGRTLPTGWMGNLTVTVEEYYPHAAVKRSFTPEPNTSESEEAVSAIRLEINAEADALWLGQNVREEIEIGGTPFHLMYGEKTIPAGFKLTLRDFRVKHDPGTENPASFESDVTLKDDSRGLVKDVDISMNKPLVHRGYRIYQSGYSLPQGAPEISIFSVGKDPGVPVKYLGAIVMVGGIMTLFYTRRFSSTAGRGL